MPYVVLDIIEKIEMSGHETETEARAHCRKHRYPLNIIFESTFEEIFENRYGPPVAIYIRGKGYNTVPIEKDVPYTTYRLIPERLPSARGFQAIIIDDKTHGEVRDEIEAAFKNGARLVWTIYEDSRMIEVHKAEDRRRFQWLQEDNTIDGGDVQPGYSIKVADLFEAVVVE